MTNREGLEQTAKALGELERRKTEFPLFYFEPNDRLRGSHNSSALMDMLAGGNRSGKTHDLVAEACSNALGYRPWVLREAGLPAPDNPINRPSSLPEDAICFDGAGVRIRVPNQILLGTGLDFKTGIAEALHPKVLSLLGPEGGTFIKKVYWGHAQTPSHVLLQNDTRIVYASAQQKGLSWESTNYAWYGLDEPIPRRIYAGVRRGMVDQFARLRFSFTPLGPNAAWMFRELYSKADGKRINVWNISIFDNKWLPPEAVKAFAEDPSISDVEKEARLYGRFLHLIDRIYPQFNEEVNIIPDIRPEAHWSIGHVIDPHTVRPWAMAWFAITPRGDIVWFKEWPANDFTKLRRDTRSPPDYALLIRELEGDRSSQIRIMDPNYGPRTDVVRGTHIPSLRDVLAEHGLQYSTELNDDLAYGESRVRALLTYNVKQAHSDINRPRMYFCESCHNLINSMLYYTASNEGITNDFPSEDKREPEYKDFADLVRYAAVSRAAEGTLTDSFLTEHLFVESDDPYAGIGAYGE